MGKGHLETTSGGMHTRGFSGKQAVQLLTCNSWYAHNCAGIIYGQQACH